jgi:hypothetical protein
MKITVTFRSEIHGKVIKQTVSAEFDRPSISQLISTSSPSPEELAKLRARELFQALIDPSTFCR